MNDEELLAHLIRLTGDLFGGADERLYRTLICAIRRGQPIDGIAPATTAPRPWPRVETLIDSATLVLLRSLIAEPDDPGRPTPLVLRRTSALPPSIAPGTWPAWAKGRRRRRTVGPFREATTRQVWFDIWEEKPPFIIYRAHGAGSEPLMVLAGAPQISGSSILLEGHDAWVSTTALDPEAPPNSWIPIAAETMSIDGDVAPVSVDQSKAVFPNTARFRLKFFPPAAVPPESSSGQAASTTLEFSGALAVSFGGGGAVEFHFDSAELETLGVAVGLTPAGQPPKYDAATDCLLIPSSADADDHALTERTSGPWTIRGRAKIAAAALAFPLCRLAGPPAELGSVDAGALAWLQLHEGLVLGAQSVRDVAGEILPIAATGGRLLARTGELWMALDPGPQLIGAQSLKPRWNAGSETASARSEFVIGYAGLKSIEAWSTARAGDGPGDGIIRRGATFRAALARPALADGKPLTLEGECDIAEQTQGERVQTNLQAKRLMDSRPIAFVLRNGLLRGRKITQLTLQASASNDEPLASGWLTLSTEVDLAVAMLADPYASDFLPWDREGSEHDRTGEIMNVVAAADWRGEEADAEIAFGFEDYRADPLADEPAARKEPPEHDDRRRIDQHYRSGFRQHAERRRLLDVSGAADYLGLALYAEPRSDEQAARASALDLDGLAFTHRLDRTDLLLLPGFLNERVGNVPNPNVLPFPALLAPLGDGGPQRLSVELKAEASLDPREVAEALVDAIDAPLLRGLVSLPFGMRASVVLDRPTAEARFEAVEVESTERRDMRGADQWRLRSGSQPIGTSSVLPGFAHQLKLGRGSDGSQHSVLGGDVHNYFNDTFSELSTAAGQTPRVPVGSIDISGRGNSLVSLWRAPGLDQESAPSSGVSEVRFTALVGRTSLEVVQITSICHPWCARFVRTVTIKRFGSGAVWRSDSGWQSAGDARFAYQGLSEPPETAAIRRLTAITNIRESEELVEYSSTMSLRLVHFDALAEIEGADRLVPVRDVRGWVEAKPAPQQRPTTLSAELLKFVLQPAAGTSRGGCFGRLDTKVKVAGSDQNFHATSLGIELGSAGPLLVGVLRGNLVMPDRGSWTIAFRGVGESAYRRLAPGDTVPLTARAGTWHLREARDLTAATASAEHALVHSSDSHRFLMPDPRWTTGANRIDAGRPALFADQFGLARAETVMPPDIDCVPMPPGTHLAIARGGHLTLDVPGTAVEVPPPAGGQWRQLVIEQTGPDNQLRLEYRGADERRSRLKFEIDTRAPGGRDWSYDIEDVCITSDLPPFGRFSTASGAIRAASDKDLKFDRLKVQFCDALESAQEIMDIMQSFSFPPPRTSGDGTVRASDYANAEEVHYAPLYIGREIDVPVRFPGPEEAGEQEHQIDAIKKDWVDIGCGKFMGKIGFFLRIGEVQKGKHRNDGEAFFGLKFEISGRLVAPIIWPFYAGGIIKVEYEWKGPRMPSQHLVKPEEEHHKLDVSAGGNGVASLDLKAFEAELSVSYLHVLSFEGVKDPFDKFKYGIKYIFEGEIDLLYGLAGLACGFETMAIPSRAQNEAGEYTDQVSVRIHSALVLEATVGWVCQAEYEVEFDYEAKAQMVTLAAYLIGNPYFLAGELL